MNFCGSRFKIDLRIRRFSFREKTASNCKVILQLAIIMRRIVVKGVGQVKHADDFATIMYSSKSTNICNEYGRSNVFITDPQHALAAKACTK